MVDIQLIRTDSEKVKIGVQKKGYDVGIVDKVLELDEKRLELLKKVEDLRKERNELGELGAQRTKEDEERGKKIKEELKSLETEMESATSEFNQVLQGIPSLPFDDVPEGKSESKNKVLRTVGEPTKFDFEPLDHVELAKKLDIIDFEAGAKVAGSGFYYLKNDAVLLELALVQYGLNFLAKKGFTPTITPDLAKEKYYLGTGYLPRGPEAQIYKAEGLDLGLIATAEVTLAGLHADETLNEKELPKKYGGYSHCFRMESGSYGKYSKGLYRVHQFTKVEMFVYSKPEGSQEMHQELLGLEEEFWESLGIPYRVVEMCTGDLCAQAARKYDLEAWMPGRGDWGEVISASNTTDYQARNLNIKFKRGGRTEFVHTLNGTLVATSRGMIAILENYQQKDGTVKVPEILVSYVGKDKIGGESTK